MSLIEISIRNEDEDWYKTVKMFGFTIYQRHDFSKDYKPRPIGFITFPDAIVEVEDEFDEEEDKHNEQFRKK